MKRFSTLTLIVAVAVIASACGAEPVPTANPADVQGTAVAAALTIVAQTQAAIPTNTLPPPTATATPTQAVQPTITQLVPTQDISLGLASPTVGAAATTSSGDPCGFTKVLAPKHGKKTIIRIWNSTKTPIAVSIFLNPTEGHGECGYRSYNLTKNGDVIITDLVYGCYNLWAWNTSGKPNFNSSGYGCINNPDKWTFTINTAVIKLSPP